VGKALTRNLLPLQQLTLEGISFFPTARMSRWHASSCKDPSITIQDDTPYCKCCDTLCPLAKLASIRADSPFLSIPKNEPPGQLNLWWPSFVPYAKSAQSLQQSATHMSEHPAVKEAHPQNLETGGRPPRLYDDAAQELKPSAADSSSQLGSQNYSPVYGDTLALDEFRLVCLAAVEDGHDAIIHVSLETYRNHKCPEYETVSYTWGGEDGDSSPCRPIFIGKYWDVLFQTKNCWEMLRFMRPWRGIRMLWVDAICINQQNVTERQQQVAKMGQIYGECSRVAVYLGGDFVDSQLGSFPSRRSLREIGSSSPSPELPEDDQQTKDRPPIGLYEVLQRRYFSRVWVVQELILSPRAVIRVGGVDYFADGMDMISTTASEQGWKWDDTAAPWAQYISRRSFPTPNLLDVLRLTSNSQASDPRDRLFGIIGLLAKESQEPGWDPDYSLSPQHIFIGTFAYFITKKKAIHLFLSAAGFSAPQSSPTWVPDWAPHDLWRKIFTTPTPNAEDVTNFIIQECSEKVAYGFLVTQWQFSQDWSDTVRDRRRWDRNIMVNTDTGALTLNLVHICALLSSPVRIGKYKDLDIFKSSGTHYTIYITTQEAFDSVCKPGEDHVYSLISEEAAVYFVLRESEKPGTYNVVTTTAYLYFSLAENTKLRFPGEIDSLYSEFNKVCGWLNSDIRRPSTDPSDVKPAFNNGWVYFPGAKKIWDLFHAWRELCNEEAGSVSRFEHTFLSCLDPKLRPRIVDGYLELKFSSTAFWDVVDHYAGLEHWQEETGEVKKIQAILWEDGARTIKTIKSPWEWRRGNDDWSVLADKHAYKFGFLSGFFLKSLPDIYLRAPMDIIRDILKSMFAHVQWVKNVLRCDYDYLEQSLRQGVSEKYYDFGSWYHDPYEGLPLEIKIGQVCIA